MKLAASIAGTYRQDSSLSRNLIRLSLFPRDLAMQWRRCGLTADFVAGFFSYRYPHCRAIQNSLSTILNEMVENAVKFSAPEDFPIEITLFDVDDEIVLQVDNCAEEAQAARFFELAKGLFAAADIEAQYLERIRNASSEESSGIGLLTLIHDFRVAVGVRLTSGGVETVRNISIQISLNPEEALV